ncbi:MAG: DUF1223 domain-containing protein [Chitinophagaceae bacterium]
MNTKTEKIRKMKTSGILIVSVVLLFILSTAFLSLPNHTSKTGESRVTAGNGFVVLELFTSEGCSSCPAADELLARVQKEAGNKPVYVLSYHVDYWDRLGWRDKFSDAQFSKRQYQYSSLLSGEVYTPQVVINGRTECVGSDESTINKGVQQGLSGAANSTLAIEAKQATGNIAIGYQVTGNTSNDQLLIAVVQKHAVSKIMRGENEGRTLSHAQIVRKLYTFDLRKAAAGTEQISVPEGFNAQDWEIIGLVQNSRTGAINAATRAAVN